MTTKPPDLQPLAGRGAALLFDPDYAPFGWGPLRGFNALPVGLMALVAMADGLESLAAELTSRHIEGTLGGAFVDWLTTAPALFALQLVLLLPMAAFIVVALNAGAGLATAARIGLMVLAVMAGAAFFGELVSPVTCAANPDWVESQACRWWAPQSWTRAAQAAHGAMWGGLAALMLMLDRRARSVARDLQGARLRRSIAARDEDEARLRSLQAQMEPHFLFNTLAHLQRLQEVDPERGRSMLRSLAEYVQVALPQMRRHRATLREELALTLAYLRVQQVRMGERLRLELAVHDAALEVELPPMMLLTLAENAVKHGLSPRPTGGILRIEAAVDGDGLTMAVLDDGIGMRVGAGAGHGLSNTLSRLAAVRGRLDIDNRPEGGVRAAIWLPLPRVATA